MSRGGGERADRVDLEQQPKGDVVRALDRHLHVRARARARVRVRGRVRGRGGVVCMLQLGLI